MLAKMFWRGHLLFSMYSVRLPSKGQYQTTASLAEQEKTSRFINFQLLFVAAKLYYRKKSRSGEDIFFGQSNVRFLEGLKSYIIE